MPEWLKGAGCKPAGVSLHWFESNSPHHLFVHSDPYPPLIKASHPKLPSPTALNHLTFPITSFPPGRKSCITRGLSPLLLKCGDSFRGPSSLRGCHRSGTDADRNSIVVDSTGKTVRVDLGFESLCCLKDVIEETRDAAFVGGMAFPGGAIVSRTTNLPKFLGVPCTGV